MDTQKKLFTMLLTNPFISQRMYQPLTNGQLSVTPFWRLLAFARRISYIAFNSLTLYA